MNPSATPFADAETWRRYDGFVRRLAVGLLADPHAADDAVQDTWAAAWTSGPRRGGAWPTWLARVVQHAAHRAQRSARRREQREAAAARPEALPSVAELRAREEVRRRVIDAVFALPPLYRDAVMLRFLDELAPHEVARRLGVPLETARTRVRRGLAQLRDDLAQARGSDWRAALALLPTLGMPQTTTAVTVMLMANKAKLASAVLVLGMAAWWCWPRERESDLAAEATVAAASLQAQDVVTDRHRTAVAPEDATRAPAAPAVTTGSLLVSVRYAGGAPAAGIALSLALHSATPELHARAATTDARGEARFVELPASEGAVSAPGRTTDHGSVRIVAGATTRVTLTVRPAGRVLGIVVDDTGRPVPGAALCVEDGQAMIARQVGVAGDDGTFLLDSVGGHLGARAPGFVPSPSRHITAVDGVDVDVRFTLGTVGSVLAGRVVTAAGLPVAGAVVVVGEPVFKGFTTAEGSAKAAAPVQRTTDHDGRFRVDDLGAVQTTLLACAHDLAPTTVPVVTHAGQTTDVVVVMQRAPSIAGQLIAPAAAMLMQAWVQVADAKRRLTRAVSARADGTFRLHHLPVGDVDVRVRADGFRQVDQTFTLAPGEERRWEVHLDAGRTLRGRVLDRRDQPVRASVLARQRASDWESHALTDADGRFTILNITGEKIDSIEFAGAYGQSAFHRQWDVTVPAEEVVFRVLARAEGEVFARGRIVDGAGAPIRSASVVLFRVGESGRGVPVDAFGVFAAGPEAPGEFILTCMADGYARRSLGRRTLLAGETWDAGNVVLQHGVPLRVRVTLPAQGRWPAALERAPNDRIIPVRGELHDLDGNPVFVAEMREASELHFVLIAPGAYRLLVSGGEWASAFIDVRVEDHSDNVIDVALARGVRCSFDVRLADPTNAGAVMRLLDHGGGALATMSLYPVRGASTPRISGSWLLPPGRYRAQLMLRDGVSAEVPFAASGAPVQILLPR